MRMAGRSTDLRSSLRAEAVTQTNHMDGRGMPEILLGSETCVFENDVNPQWRTAPAKFIFHNFAIIGGPSKCRGAGRNCWSAAGSNLDEVRRIFERATKHMRAAG